MQLSRFDFKVPDYTIWRAQALKNVTPTLRPEHCVHIFATVYYRMVEDSPLAIRTYMFEDIDEPKEGFPLLCHFLGYWREELHDQGRLELVDIPIEGDVSRLALRYPTGRGGSYRFN